MEPFFWLESDLKAQYGLCYRDVELNTILTVELYSGSGDYEPFSGKITLLLEYLLQEFLAISGIRLRFSIPGS
jgi:hypothetical protein